jgi:hypothetical protein
MFEFRHVCVERQKGVQFATMHSLISSIYRMEDMTRTPKLGAMEHVQQCVSCVWNGSIVSMSWTRGMICVLGYQAWGHHRFT